MFLHAMVAQAHVGFALPATAALALATCAVLRRRRAAPTVGVAIAAASVGAVCWSPVIIDVVLHDGGNVAALARWVLDNDEPRDPRLWPVAIRIFAFPLSVAMETIGLERWVTGAATLLAASMIGGLVLVRVQRPRHPLTRALLVSTELQIVTAAISLALLRGPAHFWLVLWLVPVFGLVCLTLISAWANARRPAHLAGAMGGLALVGLVLHHEVTRVPPAEPGEIRRAAVISGCLLGESGTTQTHLALYGPDAWRESAGLALGLVREGHRVVMDPAERYRFGEAVEYMAPPEVWFLPTLTVASGPYCERPLTDFGVRCLTASFRLEPERAWAREHTYGDWVFVDGGAASLSPGGVGGVHAPLFAGASYDIALTVRSATGVGRVTVALDGDDLGAFVVTPTDRELWLEDVTVPRRASHALTVRADERVTVEVGAIRFLLDVPPACVDAG